MPSSTRPSGLLTWAWRAGVGTSTIAILLLSKRPLCHQPVLISALATMCIALTLAIVLGGVVLAGWHRSLIDSLVLSAGIGMACDFAAHLGFAYRQANAHAEAASRTGLARLAVRRMAPAITAAAASTAIMGALMSRGGTAFTSKFGLFILLLMAAGWCAGFLFLVPLLASVGPVGPGGGDLGVLWTSEVRAAGRWRQSSVSAEGGGLPASSTTSEGSYGVF
jgi:hypothetical protein